MPRACGALADDGAVRESCHNARVQIQEVGVFCVPVQGHRGFFAADVGLRLEWKRGTCLRGNVYLCRKIRFLRICHKGGVGGKVSSGFVAGKRYYFRPLREISRVFEEKFPGGSGERLFSFRRRKHWVSVFGGGTMAQLFPNRRELWGWRWTAWAGFDPRWALLGRVSKERHTAFGRLWFGSSVGNHQKS